MRPTLLGLPICFPHGTPCKEALDSPSTKGTVCILWDYFHFIFWQRSYTGMHSEGLPLLRSIYKAVCMVHGCPKAPAVRLLFLFSLMGGAINMNSHLISFQVYTHKTNSSSFTSYIVVSKSSTQCEDKMLVDKYNYWILFYAFILVILYFLT